MTVPPQPYAPVPPLAAGARVALVAPSGPVQGDPDVERAVANVETFGWTAVVGAHARARRGYLAGTDAQRLDDLNRALRDDAVDAVWCLRGGYGVTRILDGVAYEALRRRPKAIIGYSDVTALHAAIGRECGLVTYHGPTARGELTPFSRNSFERALCYGEDPCGTAHGARTLRPGVAHGVLLGGNLALLCALVGTRYFPNLTGAILVLEDVNEPLYRVDRMLWQLRASGALARIAALAFGQCTACDGADAAPATGTSAQARTQDGRALDDVLREVADALNVPCVAGLPVGHVADQWTLPLGAAATLDAEMLTFTVHTPRRIGRIPMAPDWTGDAPVGGATSHVTEISPQDALALYGAADVAFLDVREPNEWSLAHIPGAIHIPRGQLAEEVAGKIPRGQRVVVYCAAGARSALAADTMQRMGYQHVMSLRDGIRGWADAGGDIED